MLIRWPPSSVSWGTLVKRTVQEAIADDVLGLAAQVGFYVFLAFFPALLFVVALASYFSLQEATSGVLTGSQGMLPEAVSQLLQEQLARLSESGDGGVAVFGLATALWSSSSGAAAMMGALNRAYDVNETRPWWRVRARALWLTVALAVLVLSAAVLAIAGPWLQSWIPYGHTPAVHLLWNVGTWAVAFALIACGVGLLFYFGPDARQDWVWITPGSVIATIIWAVASVGFRYYVTSFGSYNETYGAIGSVMIVLLWIYLSVSAVLLGAELNSEIVHAVDALDGRAEVDRSAPKQDRPGSRAAASPPEPGR